MTASTVLVRARGTTNTTPLPETNMDRNRIDKLMAVHCLIGIAHEAGTTILDGARLRDRAETEMQLDFLHADLMRYVRRLANSGGLSMSVGERAGSPGQIRLDEPPPVSAVTSGRRDWAVARRLEALDYFIDRVFDQAPEVIGAAQRQDIGSFDQALQRLVVGLASDAARIMSAEHMPRGRERYAAAP